MPGKSPAESPSALAHSAAFREASLKSEVRRAYAAIGVLMLIALSLAVRSPTRELDESVRLVGGIAMAILFGLQLASVAFARWAARRARTIPIWFIATTVVTEALLPAGTMLAHIVSGSLSPYAALSTPPLLAYGILISLNTLRLRPGLCLLQGVIGAASYLGTVMYVRHGLGQMEPTTGLPRLAYLNTPVLILVTGLGAAWVAREIRAHLEAALGEAETRRKMERIEQDLSVARSIQQALLPRGAPEIPGFEIAGWNRPADQTGGDYYDWQALPDGNWLVTLADVSGHGIGPAMVTAACRAYMRASSAQHQGDLGSLATRVNALLAEDLPDGRFVTMVSVLISRSRLALLSAGHGPIVLYVGATGEVKDIMPRDVPLAVAPDMRFGPAEVLSLGPGDVLALVTDGFVEWARPGDDDRSEQFGLARLRESLRRHAGLGAGAMIEAVAADVAAFAGGEPQQDDLTMVVIRRVR